MATIEVEIDLDDLIDQIGEKRLARALEARGWAHCSDDENLDLAVRSDFSDDRAAREYLFEFMDIQPWKGRRDLLAAIDELFDL
jgi:hypothetical protein